MLLKNCAYIITQNSKRDVLLDHDVLIKGNRIVKIGKSIGPAGSKEIECSKKIIMPGLINTHAHLGMHSLKGMCDDETLFDWLEVMNKEESGFDIKKILKNTREGAIECVKNGTTTVYDSYKFAPERKSVFEEIGMRAFVSSTVTKEKHLKHIRRQLEEFDSNLVKSIIAGHSAYRCSADVLREIIGLSKEKGIIRRIHVSEAKQEVDVITKETGMSPIRYLDSIGFLGKRTLLVHSIWVDDEELQIIAKRGCSVSHNPISNMKLGSGNVAPVVRMLKLGINVGLGTDSVASNNDLDMFEELKVTALLHKHHNADPKAMNFQTVLDMATINGAKCLMLDDVGSIEEGKKADLITLDFEGLTPVNNIVSNIVYCANGHNVCDVIIDGKHIVRDKEFIS